MRLVVFVLCLLSGYAAASSVGVISGESLRKSLDRFSIHGINIVSTSWSVPRRLKVADVPPSHLQVRAQAEWLLAQHGLRLVMVDLRNGFVSKAQIPTFIQEELQIPERNAPKEIEEMVVFARYQLSNKTRLSQRLDKQDFDSMPSIGRDTLRSLQNLPGISNSGISARHRFRGGDGNEVLYLLDDLELVAPFHFEGFHELFSTLNPNIIQSGDVYVGGYPVKYGSKMSGVVNLDLIEPSHVLGGTLDLNLYAGSVNVTGYKGNWDWLFSARQSVLNQGLQQIETDYGRAKFHDELVRVSWQSSQDEHVLGMLNTEDKINLRDEGGGEFGTADVKYQAAWWKWSRDLRGNANMEWRLSWTAADISRRGIRLNGDVTEGQLFESRDFDLFRLQNDWGWTLSPSWEVLLGWSYAFHNGQFIADLTSTYAPIYQPIQGALTRQRNLDSKRSGTSSYLFISSTNTFGKLSVTSGIRLDGQDIDPVHVNQISARSSLNYEIDDSLNLFLNIGRYTQQQQLRELQIDDGKLELDLPQHSDQANLGLQWVGDTWSLRVEGYYRQIKKPWSRFENLYNPWTLLPELQGDRYLVNADRAKIKGVELGVQWRPNARLKISGSYAYSDARELISGQWRARPWDQKHTIRMSADWRSESWIVGVSILNRSGWRTTPFISNPNQLSGHVNTAQLPSYVSIDMRVSKTIQSLRGEWLFYADVSNLAGRENVGGYDYISSTERKQQNLLPTVPTLGVSFSW